VIGAEALESALAKGLHIFPVGPDKKPLVKWTLESTDEPRKAAKLWKRFPQGQIGVNCGQSRIVAIDCDCKNGANGLSNFADLMDKLDIRYLGSWRSKTPSGGEHFLWRCTGKMPPCSIGRIAPGVDVRGQGGYIVIPPSKIDTGNYEYLNDWGAPLAFIPAALYELLITPEVREYPAIEKRTIQNAGDGSHWLQKYVDRARPGNRNQNCFYLAIQLRDDGFSMNAAESIIMQYASRVTNPTNPFTTFEAIQTLRSAYKSTRREPAGKVAA
jgi:hypothetical protein